MGHNPAPYVIVGMMCCFGGISRAPLAVMLMVAEMTGSLSILGPAMIAVGLAWFIVRRSDDTIYRSQLKSRADAPAQRLLIGMPVLGSVPVRQAMAPPRLVLDGDTSVTGALRQLEGQGLSGAPGGGRGRAGSRAPSRWKPSGWMGLVTTGASGQWLIRQLRRCRRGPSLDVAVEAITTSSQHWVAVLDGERKVVGTVATSDVVRGYRLGLLASLQRMNPDAAPDSTDRVQIAKSSALDNRRLRDARLPPSIIITTIQRNRDLVVPNGDTVLGTGDELVAHRYSERHRRHADNGRDQPPSHLAPSASNGTTNAQIQHPLPSETTA